MPSIFAEITQPVSFPVNGLLLYVLDTQNPSNFVHAILTDVVASFTAPSAQFLMRITAWHQGFKLPCTGAVESDPKVLSVVCSHHQLLKCNSPEPGCLDRSRFTGTESPRRTPAAGHQPAR